MGGEEREGGAAGRDCVWYHAPHTWREGGRPPPSRAPPLPSPPHTYQPHLLPRCPSPTREWHPAQPQPRRPRRGLPGGLPAAPRHACLHAARCPRWRPPAGTLQHQLGQQPPGVLGCGITPELTSVLAWPAPTQALHPLKDWCWPPCPFLIHPWCSSHPRPCKPKPAPVPIPKARPPPHPTPRNPHPCMQTVPPLHGSSAPPLTAALACPAAVPAAMPPMMPAMMPPHATAFGPPGMMELFQGGFPAMMPGEQRLLFPLAPRAMPGLGEGHPWVPPCTWRRLAVSQSCLPLMRQGD